MKKDRTSLFKLLLLTISLFGLFLFSLSVFLLNPYVEIPSEGFTGKVNIFSLIVFYLGFFLFLGGIFSAIVLGMYSCRHSKIEQLYLCVTTSFRRGMLLAGLVTILLFLQSLRLLIWWDALLVATGVILLEMYLSVR